MSLLSKSGWIILSLMSLVVALAVGSFLLEKYPYPTEDIAVVIALPLSFFWAIPSVLLSAWPSIPVKIGNPDRTPRTPTLSPLKQFSVRAIVLLFSVFPTGVLIAISMLAASFIYPALGVAWAVGPIHSISIGLLEASGIPTLLAIAFLAGAYFSTALSSSQFWDRIFNETRKAASHFHQAA
jgi:hypothetical protein